MREILLLGENKNSEWYNLATEFWAHANTDIASIHYGVFQDQYKDSGATTWLPPTGEAYRYDASVLGIIDER